MLDVITYLTFSNLTRIHNDNPSVNDSERMRRFSATQVLMGTVAETTPLPKGTATFWPSNNNKLLLEKPRANQSSKGHEHPSILSQLCMDSDDWQCIQIHNSAAPALHDWGGRSPNTRVCPWLSPGRLQNLRCYLQLYRCDSYLTVSCAKLSPEVTGGTVGTGRERHHHPCCGRSHSTCTAGFWWSMHSPSSTT